MRHCCCLFICLTAHFACAAEPFQDVTKQLKLDGLSGSVAAWGDFDRDGWVDLYVGGQLLRKLPERVRPLV